ncbi:MAG: hypothetical protein KKB59_19100 [Spirochaetes bacterium]|nr:hypothetical protein [Spirochaetota bacterium]
MIETVISIVTIAQMQLLTRKKKLGIYVGLVSQSLWLYYIIDEQAWGLIWLNIFLWYIYVTGLMKWREE